jgi:hypothetical protein
MSVSSFSNVETENDGAAGDRVDGTVDPTDSNPERLVLDRRLFVNLTAAPLPRSHSYFVARAYG